MGKCLDLTNKRFEFLLVKKKAGKDKQGNILWLCECACGKEILVRTFALNDGSTKSCGCRKSIIQSQRLRDIWNKEKLEYENLGIYKYLHKNFVYLEDHISKKGGLWKKHQIMGTGPIKKAGTVTGNGYVHVSIMGEVFLEHHLVWIMFNGLENFNNYKELGFVIDHKDGVRDNNRINNLNFVSRADNSRNCTCHRNGKHIGVGYNKTHEKWYAYTCDTNRKFLGSYDSEKEAVEAYELWVNDGCLLLPIRDTKRYEGVHYNKRNGVYEAKTKKIGDKLAKHLGSFKTQLEAIEARQKWENSAHEYSVYIEKMNKESNIINNPKRHLTKEEILSKLVYDRESGRFFHQNGKLAGNGYEAPNRYITIGLFGKAYFAHELVLICEGQNIMNDLEILHLDDNKQNNKYDNLIQDTHSVNMQMAAKNKK